MARLLITNGVQEGRVLYLRAGINRIGRSIENHFQIPDPSVSAAHCEVVFSDESVLVRDLNSTNGTFIDGEQVREGQIRVGQHLQLGNVQMTCEQPLQSAAGTLVNIPDLPLEKPAASLRLADGSLACANHPEASGKYQCSKCQQALCDACVRLVRRVSGGEMVFCSLCGGPCDALIAPEAAPMKRRFFGRLSQTLRVPFRRHKADQSPPPPE